jgi:metal-responsive CopG/Arc/MetJ family transcriptional regulator
MSASPMKTTTVQLPKKLLKELQEIARKEGRSLASQVRIFLAESVTRSVTFRTESEP